VEGIFYYMVLEVCRASKTGKAALEHSSKSFIIIILANLEGGRLFFQLDPELPLF
jgi:hypothetical protein